jgi:hypothetical protein
MTGFALSLLLAGSLAAHEGWLVAQAEATTVVTTTDGKFFSGVVQEDLPQGIILKLPNGETVFVERAKIKSQAKSASAVSAPEAAPAPAPEAAPLQPVAAPADLAELWGRREVMKMSALELNDEVSYLVSARPSMVLPTLGIVFGSILSVAGVALITVGDVVWGAAYRRSCSQLSWNPVAYQYTTGNCSENNLTANTLYVGIGIGSLILGAALLTLGIIVSVIRGPVRKAMNARIDVLEQQLQRREIVDRYKQSSLPALPGGLTLATF